MALTLTLTMSDAEWLTVDVDVAWIILQPCLQSTAPLAILPQFRGRGTLWDHELHIFRDKAGAFATEI